MFRVTIIQATGIPREYADVFVQYRSVSCSLSRTSLNDLLCRFNLKNDMIFSTEPLHNDHQELALGFYHMTNVIQCASSFKMICLYYSSMFQ